MARTTEIDGATLDIQAQLSVLRERLDTLLDRGTAAATGMVRATADEIDTVAKQARNEPVATAMVALGGAMIGFLLARMIR
jgi:hypothetical protein